MKKAQLLIIVIIGSILLWSCHKDDDYSKIDIAKVTEIHSDAIDQLNTQLNTGHDIETSINQCIIEICQSPDVEKAYRYEDDIIIKYKTGEYSVIILTDREQENNNKSCSDYKGIIPKSAAGEQITNLKVLIWEPSVDGLTYNSIHTGDQIENVFSSASLHFEINHLKKEQCTVSSLTNLTQYGFVYIKAHGCTFKNDNGEDLCWIVTGEKCTQNSASSSFGEKIVVTVAEYDNSEEVSRFRKYDPTWGVSNKFISNKVNGVFNGPAVVFVQACHSYDNSSMRNAFINDKHASAYLGYKHCVTHPFGYEKGMEFVTNMLDLHKNAQDAYFDIEEDVDNTVIGYIIGLFGERAILCFSSNSHPTYFAKERYVECQTLNKRWNLYSLDFHRYNQYEFEYSSSGLMLWGGGIWENINEEDEIIISFETSRNSVLSAGTYYPFNIYDEDDWENWENQNYPMRFLTGTYSTSNGNPESQIYFSQGNQNYQSVMISGDLNVQYQNELRTITFSFTDGNGRYYTGKYEE